jgi:hypothetical protein
MQKDEEHGVFKRINSFYLNWNDERGEADGVYLDDHSYK